MLASKDAYLQEASEPIFRMSADELVHKRCRDREEYYQDLRNYERKIEQDRIEHEQDIRTYEQRIAKKDTLIRQLLAENEALKKMEI